MGSGSSKSKSAAKPAAAAAASTTPAPQKTEPIKEAAADKPKAEPPRAPENEKVELTLSLPQAEVDRRAAVASKQATAEKDSKGYYVCSLTEAGKAAAAAAAAAAETDAAAAAMATPEEREAGPRWIKYGGGAIEELLSHTPLLTIQYLIALAKADGILPRGQELPAAAKVTAENAWRLKHNGMYRIPILVLSYAWADPFHPDRGGGLLKQILPILETMLEQATNPQMTGHGVNGKGNKFQTVGVFIDYCCLPQAPRSKAEDDAFQHSLREMWRWYAHPLTTVLLCTLDLPSPPEPTNPKTYEQRGWCFCERRMASLAKGNNTLWDLRNYRPGMSFEDLWQEMRKGGVRQPFLSPDSLGDEIRKQLEEGKLVFSYAADMKVVVSLYKSAFEEAFRDVTKLVPACDRLFFCDYGWDDSDLPVLLEAFDYMRAHKCCPSVPIRLLRNNFSPEAQEKLRTQLQLNIEA